MRFAFILAEKASFPVRVMCRVLEVSPSGFYAWCKRPEAKRTKRDRALSVVIADAHRQSRGTYGSPRVHAELQALGFEVGRNRIARLMRLAGLEGVRPKRFVVTTDSKHDAPVAKNLVNRKFEVEAPNQLWATDITYVRTWEGWLYLAVVIDLFSRKVVGWSTAARWEPSFDGPQAIDRRSLRSACGSSSGVAGSSRRRWPQLTGDAELQQANPRTGGIGEPVAELLDRIGSGGVLAKLDFRG